MARCISLAALAQTRIPSGSHRSQRISPGGATKLTSPPTRVPLFNPSVGTLDATAAWRWFENIEVELAASVLTDPTKVLLHNYYSNAGLLRQWRRPFFRRHYTFAVAAAAKFLLNQASNRSVRILDLGCGYGTQSLLFAALGASVVALDGQSVALDVARERVAVYE